MLKRDKTISQIKRMTGMTVGEHVEVIHQGLHPSSADNAKYSDEAQRIKQERAAAKRARKAGK